MIVITGTPSSCRVSEYVLRKRCSSNPTTPARNAIACSISRSGPAVLLDHSEIRSPGFAFLALIRSRSFSIRQDRLRDGLEVSLLGLTSTTVRDNDPLFVKFIHTFGDISLEQFMSLHI